MSIDTNATYAPSAAELDYFRELAEADRNIRVAESELLRAKRSRDALVANRESFIRYREAVRRT